MIALFDVSSSSVPAPPPIPLRRHRSRPLPALAQGKCPPLHGPRSPPPLRQEGACPSGPKHRRGMRKDDIRKVVVAHRLTDAAPLASERRLPAQCPSLLAASCSAQQCAARSFRIRLLLQPRELLSGLPSSIHHLYVQSTQNATQTEAATQSTMSTMACAR